MKRAPWTALVLLWGGCASPNPDFYTLYPEPGSSSQDVAMQIELRRPGLPGYLDRPNLVRRVEAGRLEISGTERWGTGLGKMVGATLARNLTQRLPRSTVYTESGVISSRPDMIVEVELQRFEAMADGIVRLDAQIALHWADDSGAAVVERYELAREPERNGTEGTVAAMSLLLAELSEAIAQSITEAVRNEPRTAGGHDSGDSGPAVTEPSTFSGDPS